MKTLRKSVASGPEFQVAILQNYISPEKSLKCRKGVGFDDWVCQTQLQAVTELCSSIPMKGLFYFYSCIMVVTLQISIFEVT